ncbi:MAG: hypothetical protein KKB31_05400, partial [Nanoarchaeota archaeon]|nr:hypothetical protein [Nanoarchaeota archaeon]
PGGALSGQPSYEGQTGIIVDRPVSVEGVWWWRWRVGGDDLFYHSQAFGKWAKEDMLKKI